MKRFLGVGLALVMLFSVCIPVFASGDYQIFDEGMLVEDNIEPMNNKYYYTSEDKYTGNPTTSSYNLSPTEIANLRKGSIILSQLISKKLGSVWPGIGGALLLESNVKSIKVSKQFTGITRYHYKVNRLTNKKSLQYRSLQTIFRVLTGTGSSANTLRIRETGYLRVK